MTRNYGDETREHLRQQETHPSRNGQEPDAPKPDLATLEVLTAAELLEMELPEARCVVDGLIPDGITLLAGKPKLGKSWLALQTGLAVAENEQALGRLDVRGGDVLYLALEDTRRRLKSRLKKLLPSGQRPERLFCRTDWPRQDKGGIYAIACWLEAHPEARLVIIDTWAKFRPARGRNSDVYEVDYQDAAEVKALADKYSVAILVVHHCRKLEASDPLDSVSGTLGLTGAADAVLVLKRERGQHDAALFVTGRDIEEQELALRWDSAGARWAVLGEADEYRISRERSEVIGVLRKAGRALTPSEVAPLIGKKVSTVKWLMWTLQNDGWLSVQDGRYTPREEH